MFFFLCFSFKLYLHKFYICLLFLINYISKVNLAVVYFFLESYPWFFRYCPWFLLKPREPGATFKNKLPLVPARLYFKAWYSNAYSSVRIDGIMSRPFKINKGVRQGGFLSTTMYKSYINDLLKNLDLEVLLHILGAKVVTATKWAKSMT